MLNYDNAFGHQDKAFEETVHTTLNKLRNNIETGREISKDYTHRRFIKRFATIAAAAVLALALTTITLAVSGVININLGAFYNSIFNNEKAVPYILTSDGITINSNDGDVTIDPVAVFYDSVSKTIYIKMLIHDPVGNRLSKSFFFYSNNKLMIDAFDVRGNVIDENTASVVFPISAFYSAEHRDGSYTIPAVSNEDSEDYIYTGNLTFDFDMIATGDDPKISLFTIFEGKWEFSIAGAQILNERKFTGEFNGHKTQAALGALSLEVTVFTNYFKQNESNDEYFFDFPNQPDNKNAVTILLKDGTVVHPEYHGGSGSIDENWSSLYYTIDTFINPAEVANISFFNSLLE